MSFSNFNNSAPQGSQLQNCSAGSPIGGIDSNNIFRLLKLTASGGITTNIPVAPTTTSYQIKSLVPVPTGAVGIKAANLALGYISVVQNAVTAGLYEVAPYVNIEANAGGSVSCILVKVGSVLDTYAQTLAYGTDPWAPTLNDTQGGLAGFWHNITLNKIGSGATAFATGTAAQNLQRTLYLEAAAYKIVVVVDTNITTTGTGDMVSGFSNFNQIG